MQTMRVRPKPGLKVLWPEDRRELRPEGEEVPCTAYWRRRLRSCDVEEASDWKGGRSKA